MDNQLVNNYSIGVVTYHARYEKYFMPLIRRLVSIFPDKEILCVINGHPDASLQANYLKKVTTFLQQFRNVRYITHTKHQSLAKCWNELIILSSTEKVLILNDDTQVTELLRNELEQKALPLPFTILNTSWSHFLISKNILNIVGWFDERLLGVGHEDADYALRMGMAGIPVTDTEVLGLENYVVDEENPGWKSISKKNGDNKYAAYNTEFFNKKWITADGNHHIKPEEFKFSIMWNKTPYFFSPKTAESTPLFYEFTCLDGSHTDTQSYYKKVNSHTLIVQKIFYAGKMLLKKIYRKIIT
jgi:hypothetical protein